MSLPQNSRTILALLAVFLFEVIAYGQAGEVRIGRILPNPEGRNDKDREIITLVNTLNAPVVLTGWILKDKDEYEKISLTGVIPPKGEITKIIKTGSKYPLLNNKGDTISLVDAQGTLQDKQSYIERQAAPGAWITFYANSQSQLKKTNEQNPLLSAPTSEQEEQDDSQPSHSWTNWIFWGVALGAFVLLVTLLNSRQRRLRAQREKEEREAALRRKEEERAAALTEVGVWLEANSEKVSVYSERIKNTLSNVSYPRKGAYESLSSEIRNDSGFMTLRIHLLEDSHPKRIQLEAIRSFANTTEAERGNLKQKFIQKESEAMSEFFDAVEKNPLTKKQRQAVVINEENNLIVAGAGSGKTSTIAARVAYLVKRGIAKPSDILVLAFNKAAVLELEQRIHSLTGPDVHIKTFHKLGTDIISEARGKMPDVAGGEEDALGKKLGIQKIITTACKDKQFSSRLIEYFRYYLVPYQDITTFKTKREYLEYLAKYELRTLNGEKVKSYGELLIANFLFLNGVEYQYEAKYEYDTATKYKRTYKPDFFLPEHNLYIEYLAIDRKGDTPSFIPKKKYKDDLVWKRDIHKTKQTVMIEIPCYHTMEGTLERNLDQILKKHGVEYSPIPQEKVFSKLQEFREITNFAKLVTTFLSHFKSNKWTVDILQDRARRTSSVERSMAFLDIFEVLKDAYEKELEEHGAIDFDDMIGQGVDYIEQDYYRPHYTHVLVDEFQDISRGRARLLNALRHHSQDKTLFCVGDDWQAIYRFAGSDVSVMREFEQYFGVSEITKLDKTFRYNNMISEFTSEFILKNPKQIKKSVDTLRHADTPQIFYLTAEKNELSLALDALNHINNPAKQEGSVLMLGRYKHVFPDKQMEQIRAAFDNLRIDFKTVHSSKGLEYDYVIILGLNSGKYGFPCQIVDDPVMSLVLPVEEEFEHSEERRLFYVACTRAKHSVYLINGIPANENFKGTLPPSTFLNEAIANTKYAEPLNTECVSKPLCPECGIGVMVKRDGPYGEFLACSFRFCDYTKNIPRPKSKGE
ncbi:UvrD-helicase domain-containing protein [Verrucomicrobia bacterium]|nr:UvrD-helicase domain-containing protein [Verrucomicrobiota bacterium]